MNWKPLLPPWINISNLSLEDCRNFKAFYQLITKNTQGPPGYRLFYPLLHHLLFYGLCCMEENGFLALHKAWDDLSPLFLTSEYDNDWLVFCWLFCDFPLNLDTHETMLDHFTYFILHETDAPKDYREHVRQFSSIMKLSRLGLYEEILSTSKITKYRELISGHVISTVRSVPYYESGEIFLTRIVSYLGDSFAIHDAKSYPAGFKQQIESMVRNKLSLVSSTGDERVDYANFMKLAGPYWMSSSHTGQSIPILSPDHYKNYHLFP